jgi:hypothetical protein
MISFSGRNLYRFAQIIQTNLRILIEIENETSFKCERMRCTEGVAWLQEMKGSCRALIGKFEGIKPHGRPRCRWEININRSNF